MPTAHLDFSSRRGETLASSASSSIRPIPRWSRSGNEGSRSAAYSRLEAPGALLGQLARQGVNSAVGTWASTSCPSRSPSVAGGESPHRYGPLSLCTRNDAVRHLQGKSVAIRRRTGAGVLFFTDLLPPHPASGHMRSEALVELVLIGENRFIISPERGVPVRGHLSISAGKPRRPIRELFMFFQGDREQWSRPQRALQKSLSFAREDRP